jgi:plastocyanin
MFNKSEEEKTNMLKKWIALFLSVVMILSVGSMVMAATSYVKSDLNVILNGQTLSLSQSYVVEGRLVVPYRAIAEKLNATVGYNASQKLVTVKKDTDTLELKIGSKTATVNGKQVTLDVSAVLINSSTYVPIRFLSENLGLTVKYDQSAKTVALNSGGHADHEEPKVFTVDIKSFAFSPKSITIPVGSTIKFTNFDTAEHTVTDKKGSFDSGLFGKGKSFTMKFTKAGEFDIYCIPHEFMVLKIVVK